MTRHLFASALLAATCAAALGTAYAGDFNIPAGDLKSALDNYSRQSGVELIYLDDQVTSVRSKGAKGELSSSDALTRILSGTGFVVHRNSSGALGVLRGQSSEMQPVSTLSMQLAQATPAPRSVETVTVTSSKLGGADVQSIPISITALSQEQLTASQTNGGPDLIKSVPNMTFTKTNFSGYSIQIRGIGTQAISVTTDPAVAVAMNDIPFIRNHFFEQEFFDLGQVEVLRGPQGTLYGRNATAGVVNLTTAKPTDQFEAMASAELGNYHQKRFEGMLNLPIVDDRLDLRIAGEWTKRNGYSTNALTESRIDGRNLWSGRVTLGLKPTTNLQTYLVWEHFSEDDDRMRSAKQLCKTDKTPLEIGGKPVPQNQGGYSGVTSYIGQGCLPESLYSPDSFQVPNGYTLPYYGATAGIGGDVYPNLNPYASTVQSPNLRVIEASIDPAYKAKNDTLEFNADYNITPALSFTSQTGYSRDFLWSTGDYNRFNTNPGVFNPDSIGNRGQSHPISADGVFCDPQLGCSDRLILQDLVKQNSWQFSQEFRLASKFDGPFNFSAGGNYMHYETYEEYYVFINNLTALAANGIVSGTTGNPASPPYVAGVTDNTNCLRSGTQYGNPNYTAPVLGCIYIDPNPIDKVNGQGHNYFLSKNPYVLNSYALFGEAYYNITQDLKLTGGLRWTEDRKHAPQIPSELLVASTYGYPALAPVDQQWDQFTGRVAANWTPKLDFTDQTLVYGSYAHGYKAGGANPPQPRIVVQGDVGGPQSGKATIHPATFKPEFVDAFELGTKNTMLDGALTLNASAFYYNYTDYQISEIVDRTAVNQNFDAHIKGAELEMVWEPMPGLRFNLGAGYEDARLAKGSKAIDLMDRTAGNPDWMVVKPFPTNSSNCVIPISLYVDRNAFAVCEQYHTHITTIPGFDTTAANNGEGFYKDLSGNMLPNAPPYTMSFGAQYSLPVSSDWAATARADVYWQADSWWRVFNDLSYDKLHGYSNLNLTLILTNQGGWQVMLYDKNVLNTTAITGAFLNSDDTSLTTNVFLTDPNLFGIRVTKNW